MQVKVAKMIQEGAHEYGISSHDSRNGTGVGEQRGQVR